MAPGRDLEARGRARRVERRPTLRRPTASCDQVRRPGRAPARTNTPVRCQLPGGPVGPASRSAQPVPRTDGWSAQWSQLAAVPDTTGCVLAPVLNTPGLLGMPGWHRPDDLGAWVERRGAAAERLRTGVGAVGPGLRLLALLHDHELLLRNALRPARYVADFHPRASWRRAAAAAAARLDAEASSLYCDARVYDSLSATAAALASVVPGETSVLVGQQLRGPAPSAAAQRQVERNEIGGGGGDPQEQQQQQALAAQLLAELGHHPGLAAAGLGQWLQLCRALRPLFLRRHTAAAATMSPAAAGVATSPAETPALSSSRSAASERSTPLPEPGADAVTGAATEIAAASGATINGVNPAADSHPQLQRLAAAVARCSEALRLLAAGRPELAPRLALHPQQYEVLRPWLPQHEAAPAELEGNAGAVGRTGGRFGSGREDELHDTSAEAVAVQWVSGRELLARVAATSRIREPQQGPGRTGTQAQGQQRRRRLLQLYDGAPPLDLDELLFDATDEALEAALKEAEREEAALAEREVDTAAVSDAGDSCTRLALPRTRAAAVDGGGGGAGGWLALVALTPELSGRLLQLHPNEGVRWQVYHSGPLRQARALLAVLDQLAALRSRLAAALGADCWADLVLQPGGAGGGGGGGGGGGLGSALGGRLGAERMLRDLGGGLMSYGDSELQSLQHAARKRAGRGGSGSGALPPGSDPLEPWNLPYMLQAAAQARALSRHDAGWSAGFADYFAPPGLLRGSDALCRSLFGISLVGPLPLSAGEAAGWVEPEPEAGRSHSGGSSEDVTEGGREGAADGGGGSDVIIKMAVACARTDQRLGILYLHLHGRLSEFPFTTLLRHGPAAGAEAGGALGVEADSGDVEGGEREQQLPVVLVRLPYRADSRSECGGPESPYFLKAWLHELGHALHHVASAAACTVTSAEAALPAQLPPAPPRNHTGSGSNDDGGGGDCGRRADDAVQHRPALLALLSGAACGLDVREVPSHLLEHALREPAGVRLLSRHGRLDCPLPQRDCARLVAQLATTFTSTVGELQSLVAAALADQLMHAPQQQQSTPGPTSGASNTPGPGPGPALHAHLEAHAAVCSLTAHHRRAALQEQQALAEPQLQSASQPLPPPPLPPPPLLVPSPDCLHHLEALAVVGGAQYVYVAARLVAAAAWRAHLQDQLHDAAATADADSWGATAGSSAGGEGGGWLVRRRLLEAGAHQPGIAVLRGLLGREAFMRVGEAEEVQLAGDCIGGADGRGGGSAEEKRQGEGQAGGWSDEGCWVPDLGAPVFQDVDLLG